MEGSSRSGKTTLLNAIEAPDVVKIYKSWPNDLQDPPIEFFLERDEDKLHRAKIAPQNIKFVDRGYLSTLTFYSVLEEQVGISAQPVYRWIINEMGRKLYRPDHYIFVDVPPEVTVDRYKKKGGLVYENNMWIKFPERINYWYNRLLAVFEPATSIYRIDGNRDPNLVLEEFKDTISKIKRGIPGD
jgi:thymidylate kinase